MWQRIQTIYLVIVAGIGGYLLLSPFSENIEFSLYPIGIQTIDGMVSSKKTIPSLLLLGTTFMVSLFSIFQYKKRVRQIRLSIFNAIAQVLTPFFLWYESNRIADSLNTTEIALTISCALPAVSTILLYLAIRAMLKDERLIRSIDSLR